MAFIHPAAGDYNPDLVSLFVMFWGSLPGSWPSLWYPARDPKQHAEGWQ